MNTSYSASDIIWIVIEVAIIMVSIILHEISHGYAAYKMGDPTAKSSGRLSLNPLKHLDPFGSVILPLMLAIMKGPIIGYAKPVPYNPNNFKNIKKGEVVVGLAGPASNFVLALIFTLLSYGARAIYANVNMAAGYWIWQVCAAFVSINLMLMFFNLIPLPPLDGSSIIAPLLSPKALVSYYKIERYSMPILLTIMILVPYITGFDPISWYINATAGKLTDLLLSI